MNTSNDDNIKKYKAIDHESYILFSLIAAIIPVAGIILGVIFLAKDDKLDKKIGEHTLALSVLFCIVWPLVWFLFLASRQTVTPVMPIGS